MEIVISNSSGKPIYEQITDQVKSQIMSGQLNAGDPLPSMRALAQSLRISLITTKRAYNDLEAEGFIETVAGKGSFVAAQDPQLLREANLRLAEDGIRRAVEVAKRLQMNGYKAEYLMGDMPQAKRLKTIERMKEGKLPILVATDVAARGLQIDDLELVVNYDIPEDFESYVHRIGRTARAGKSGKAITLACEEYIYGLEPIERYIQMKIPVLWPDEAGLEKVEDKSEGFRYRGSRRPSSSSSHKGPRQDGRRGSKPAPRKAAAAKKAEGGDKKRGEDYDKLSKMTLEERMAYYKKEFGASDSTDRRNGQNPRKGGQGAQRKPGQNPQKKQGQGQRRPQQKAPQQPQKAVVQRQPEPTPAKEVKVVKKGIFSRIFDKLRGK